MIKLGPRGSSHIGSKGSRADPFGAKNGLFLGPRNLENRAPATSGGTRAQKEAILGPQKLAKNDQEAKKNSGTRFSIAKRRKMMTRGLSWAPKADFVKILLPLVAAAGFSRLRGGPKRLKTDPFEVKNAQSTSNGAFLRVLKKFFGLLKKH